jgi:hypothetical protein
MLEIILASTIIGKVQVGPELVQYDLLTQDNQHLVVLEDTTDKLFEVQ